MIWVFLALLLAVYAVEIPIGLLGHERLPMRLCARSPGNCALRPSPILTSDVLEEFQQQMHWLESVKWRMVQALMDPSLPESQSFMPFFRSTVQEHGIPVEGFEKRVNQLVEGATTGYLKALENPQDPEANLWINARMEYLSSINKPDQAQSLIDQFAIAQLHSSQKGLGIIDVQGVKMRKGAQIGKGENGIVSEVFYASDPKNHPATLVSKEFFKDQKVDSIFTLMPGWEEKLPSVQYQNEKAALSKLGELVHFDDSSRTLIMKKIPGITMKEALIRIRDQPDKMLQLREQMLDAIGELHKKGVAHGDIHVNNILVDQKSGKMSFIDYGYSRLFDPQAEKDQLVKYSVSNDYFEAQRRWDKFANHLHPGIMRILYSNEAKKFQKAATSSSH